MRAFGVDATEQVSVPALKAAGGSFVMRYLSRYGWKVVGTGEAARYTASGIHYGLVFEDGARNAWSGYDAGKADAEFAVKQARDKLGVPLNPNVGITFAVDADTAGNPGATDGYFDGAAAVLGRGRCGPYGGYEVVEHQYNRGFRALWQTYAWSGGRLHAGANVFQYSNDHNLGGVGVDFDYAYDLSLFYNYKAAPADPLRYLWFAEGPFTWHDGSRAVTLLERATVRSYDVLSQHPIVNRNRLKAVQHALFLLADRVWWVAHNDPSTGKPRPSAIWQVNKLGWRWQQLYRRSQGKRVNKDFKP